MKTVGLDSRSVLTASVLLLALSSFIGACGSGSAGRDAGSDGPLDALRADESGDQRGSKDGKPNADTLSDLSGPSDVRSSDARGETGGSDSSDLNQEVVPWVFNRSDYDPVNGWILLDADPEWTKQVIDKAAQYGVKQIQLSHSHIMNVEDIIGDTPEILARVDALNAAIVHAHEHGISAYVWVHELSGVTGSVCWDPADPLWESRANAYRLLAQKLTGLDGVVLMFGSAPLSPWFAFCSCDWCKENWPEAPLLSLPPNSERIRMLTERLGPVITEELGLDLVMRVFVHEPSENAWHSDGLASVGGVKFTTMHKGTVQDWQPYNPSDPTLGKCGPHPAMVEVDAAGEYWGLSILPFCSPGYFWYLMQPMWANYGVGYVARVERGNRHAIGTPNEVNLLALQRLAQKPETSLRGIWNEFLEQRYSLEPGSEASNKMRELLALSFPIRLKSHYALGIWALGKDSDFPEGVFPEELGSRGKMPKWDANWQTKWESLDKPNRQVVMWVFQEGTEAVELAQQALAGFEEVKGQLAPEAAADLCRRLTHQWLSARAWRAMDLIIWSYRAFGKGNDFAERGSWHVWAADELAAVRTLMEEAGLGGAGVAEPAGITKFLSNVPGGTPVGVEGKMPPVLFSAMRITQSEPTSVTVRFTVHEEAEVFLNFGQELPIPELVSPQGVKAAGEELEVTFSNLVPEKRYVVRPRAVWNGADHYGGEMWVFTRE